MSEALIIDFTIKAMMLVLWLSLPPILVATVAGVLVSLVQALTQIQEQTLGFTIKLVAVVVTMLFTASWIGGELYNLTVTVFDLTSKH